MTEADYQIAELAFQLRQEKALTRALNEELSLTRKKNLTLSHDIGIKNALLKERNRTIRELKDQLK
jgi:hypothetical protein